MTLTKAEMEALARKIGSGVGATKKETEQGIRAYMAEPEYSAGDIIRNNGRELLSGLGAPGLAKKFFGEADD